jgi:hypothetical protein
MRDLDQLTRDLTFSFGASGAEEGPGHARGGVQKVPGGAAAAVLESPPSSRPSTALLADSSSEDSSSEDSSSSSEDTEPCCFPRSPAPQGEESPGGSG